MAEDTWEADAKVAVEITIKGPLPKGTRATELVDMLRSHLEATIDQGQEIEVRSIGGAFDPVGHPGGGAEGGDEMSSSGLKACPDCHRPYVDWEFHKDGSCPYPEVMDDEATTVEEGESR